jgi:hypothetical protein
MYLHNNSIRQRKPVEKKMTARIDNKQIVVTHASLLPTELTYGTIINQTRA